MAFIVTGEVLHPAQIYEHRRIGRAFELRSGRGCDVPIELDKAVMQIRRADRADDVPWQDEGQLYDHPETASTCSSLRHWAPQYGLASFTVMWTSPHTDPRLCGTNFR